MATLKQGAGYLRLFMMIASSDHISGLTGASPVVKLSKAGATGVTAANSPATEVDSTNNPGLYKILLNTTDVSTLGDLGIHCTAASADPTDFIDQVKVQIFTDLNLDNSGNAVIGSNIKKNQALAGFSFVMTLIGSNLPGTGLTVTAQRSLNGAGFAPCANSVSELSNGVYTINLAATDTNANTVLLRFTATGANDQDILLITQP